LSAPKYLNNAEENTPYFCSVQEEREMFSFLIVKVM